MINSTQDVLSEKLQQIESNINISVRLLFEHISLWTFSYIVCFVHRLVFNTRVLVCIFRATVSAVSCLVVLACICIDLLISCALKIK